ncbi:MAG: c-type cytochrome [Pseudomonadales bacterium]|nr:c-type cytochrome [Pseudomonadales bacterium]
MIRKRLIISFLIALAGISIPLQAAEEREPFDDRYCTTCHGADGRGNYGVQAPRLAGMEDWYLIRQLENFRAGIRGVHPRDIEGIAMRPMAAKLTDESITDIVDWVGSWEYLPTEVTVEGDAAAGAQLYSQCATCHGADGQGNEALGAPALRGQNDWYLVTQLRNFKQGWRGSDAQDSYGQQMMAMVQMLADDDTINNVVSYINTLGRN